MKRAVAAIGAGVALLAVGFAEAQPRRDPVLGAWRFKTESYDGGCRMTGAMTIRPAARAGAYTCAFTAVEACPEQTITAQQTCTADRQGDRLVMRSVITATTPPSASYAPDDWELTIESADRMTGELRSADVAPVEFFRVRPIPIS